MTSRRSLAEPLVLWERAYARLAAASAEIPLTMGPPTGDGWLTGRELSESPAAFDRLVEHERARIREEYGGEPRPYVAAAWALHHYGWSAALAVAGPYLAAGVVPHIGLADLAVRPCRLAGLELAVHPTGLTCRNGVGSGALRAELRRAVALLLAPVYESPAARAARRAPAALWRAAADALTGALCYVGGLLGDERAAAGEALRILGDGTHPIPPYTGGAIFREFQLPDGTRQLTRERNDCCFLYTIAPGAPCLSCPRLSNDARLRRLSETRLGLR
jgi:hypothetical protein